MDGWQAYDWPAGLAPLCCWMHWSNRTGYTAEATEISLLNRDQVCYLKTRLKRILIRTWAAAVAWYQLSEVSLRRAPSWTDVGAAQLRPSLRRWPVSIFNAGSAGIRVSETDCCCLHACMIRLTGWKKTDWWRWSRIIVCKFAWGWLLQDVYAFCTSRYVSCSFTGLCCLAGSWLQEGPGTLSDQPTHGWPWGEVSPL